MSKETFKELQRGLATVGLYTGDIDGLWGSGSQGAFDRAIGIVQQTQTGTKPMQIAWGAKVSKPFLDKARNIVAALNMPPAGLSDLMTCIAWESGRTFSASVVNKAGSGATGLIQFMPATAIAYFNTPAAIAKMSDAQKKAAGIEACAKLAKMSAEEQLDYVLKYFMPYTGRLKNLGDLYMSILWPRGVGQSDDYILWDQNSRPTTYRQNSGLDVNKDGAITRGECLVKLKAMMAEGLKPGNVLEAA